MVLFQQANRRLPSDLSSVPFSSCLEVPCLCTPTQSVLCKGTLCLLCQTAHHCVCSLGGKQSLARLPHCRAVGRVRLERQHAISRHQLLAPAYPKNASRRVFVVSKRERDTSPLSFVESEPCARNRLMLSAKER